MVSRVLVCAAILLVPHRDSRGQAAWLLADDSTAYREASGPVDVGHRLMSTVSSDVFIAGVDVSFLPELEATGAVFSDQAFSGDALAILKSYGFNTVRIRLWHTPNPDVSGLNEVTQLAARAKAMGFAFHLDFHYSDWWADPAHQNIPAAWAALDLATLVDSVYAYSKHVTETLVAAGATPDAVQLGNEIAGGLLWDYGRVGGAFNDATQWDQLVALLTAGRDGVNDGLDGSSTDFIVHIDKGADLSVATWFYDNLASRDFEFDTIGLTYYPWWQGTLTDFSTTVDGLASRYGKPVVLVETAYPWTLDWDDATTNIVGSTSQLHSGYDATVGGQTTFLEAVIAAVKSAPSGLGKGVIYWAGDYTSSGSLGSFWENVALFDFDGELLPSVLAFQDAVLAIELTDFHARLDGSDVVLSWSLTSDNTVTSIAVQSARAGAFDTIGMAPQSRLGVADGEYRVTSIPPGHHSFRLELMKADGTVEYSNAVDVAVDLDAMALVSSVYPNPFQTSATLDIRVRDAQYLRARLYAMDGRLVDTLAAQFVPADGLLKLTIDRVGLAAGVYFVVVTGEHFELTRKAVKL